MTVKGDAAETQAERAAGVLFNQTCAEDHQISAAPEGPASMLRGAHGRNQGECTAMLDTVDALGLHLYALIGLNSTQLVERQSREG